MFSYKRRTGKGEGNNGRRNKIKLLGNTFAVRVSLIALFLKYIGFLYDKDWSRRYRVASIHSGTEMFPTMDFSHKIK